MKKTAILLIVLALLVPVTAMAQDRGNTDNRIFGIQVGFLGGYNLAMEENVVGRDFGLFFTLSNTMQVGFRSITSILHDGLGFIDAMLFDFGYALTPQINFDLLIGNAGAGNTVGGLDISYAIGKSLATDVFSSTLKLKAGYLFDTDNGIGEGAIIVGLVGSIGY